MRSPTRCTSHILGATMLVVAIGCGSNGGETSSGGDVASQTPAATPAVPASPSDLDAAEERVERALRADSTLRPFRLDADDERGALVLEGVVATEAQKSRATRIAADSASGISVDNQVRVDAAVASGTKASDAADEAEDKVEDALDADAALRAFDLDVDDENGQLVLKGTVSTASQRTQAENIVKRVAPGIRIDNRIKVQ
jgi:osmotically-inducible protein OsmY